MTLVIEKRKLNYIGPFMTLFKVMRTLLDMKVKFYSQNYA